MLGNLVSLFACVRYPNQLLFFCLEPKQPTISVKQASNPTCSAKASKQSLHQVQRCLNQNPRACGVHVWCSTRSNYYHRSPTTLPVATDIASYGFESHSYGQHCTAYTILGHIARPHEGPTLSNSSADSVMTIEGFLSGDYSLTLAEGVS